MIKQLTETKQPLVLLLYQHIIKYTSNVAFGELLTR